MYGLKIRFRTREREDIPAYIVSLRLVTDIENEPLEEDSVHGDGEIERTALLPVDPYMDYTLSWLGSFEILKLTSIEYIRESIVAKNKDLQICTWCGHSDYEVCTYCDRCLDCCQCMGLDDDCGEEDEWCRE